MRQYAEHRRARGLAGGTHVAVRKAIRDGRLTTKSATKRGRRWLIDPTKADREWNENTAGPKQRDPETLSTARKAAAEARRAELAQAEQGRLFGDDSAPRPRRSSTEASDGGSETMAKAQRIRAVYEARMAELRYRERAGELVRRSDVEGTTFQIFRSLRDRVFAVIDRIGPLCAAETSEAQVREIMREDLARAFSEVADSLTPPERTDDAIAG